MLSNASVRVGYILKMFPRLSETFILNEILALESQGISLHIFSIKRPNDPVIHTRVNMVKAPVIYLPETIRSEPIRIACALINVFFEYPLSFLRTLKYELSRKFRKSNSRSLRKFCQACCIISDTKEIQHWHAHFATAPTRLASLVHMITGLPYSISTHAKDLYFEGRIENPTLERRMTPAHFIIANSKESARDICSSLNKGDSSKIYTIYNGLNLPDFPPRLEEPQAPIILSVGRLEEKKGFHYLIEACRVLLDRNIDFKCEIVGSGSLKRDLNQQIINHKLVENVRLLGPMPQHELKAHYYKARVFTLPCIISSNNDRDVLPNVLKEAMAIGIPVVTTLLPAIKELIEDGVNGILVPPGDPELLAESLELLLANSSLRSTLAINARNIIEERFNCNDNVSQLKNLFINAIRDESVQYKRAEEVIMQKGES